MAQLVDSRDGAPLVGPAIVAVDALSAEPAVELIDEQGLPPSRAPDFGSAVRWNLAGTMVRIAMTVFAQMLLLRVVGPAIAGQNAIFMIIVGIGSIISEGGMLAALMQVPEMTRPVLRNAVFLILLYAGVVSIGMIVAAPLLIRLFALPAADLFIPIVAALNVVPLALTSVPTSVLKRNYRAREIQAVQISIYFVAFLCIGLPIALLHPSVVALMVAFTLQTVLGLVALWIVARCPVVPLARGAGAIRGMSLKGLGANVSYFLNESVANVATAHFLGTFEVGLYGTSSGLARLPTDTIINTIHGPLMASAARDEAEAPERFLNALNLVVVVVLPTYLVAALCARSTLSPLLGEKWISAAPVLAVVIIAMLFRLVGMLSNATLWGKGALKTDIGSQWIALVAFVTLFALVRPDTAAGVALLTLIAWALRTVVQVTIAVRLLALSAAHLMRRFVLPTFVSVLFVVPVRWLYGQFGERPSFANLALLAFLVLALFIMRLIFAARIDGADWISPLVRRFPEPMQRHLVPRAGAFR